MTGRAVSEPRSSGSRRRRASRAPGACRRHPPSTCPRSRRTCRPARPWPRRRAEPPSAAIVIRLSRSSAPRRSIARPVVPMIPASTPRMAPSTRSAARDGRGRERRIRTWRRHRWARRRGPSPPDRPSPSPPSRGPSERRPGCSARRPTTAASSRPAATAPASIAPDASTRRSERSGRAAASVIASGTSSIAHSAASANRPTKEDARSASRRACRAAGQMDTIRGRQLGAVQHRLADARRATAAWPRRSARSSVQLLPLAVQAPSRPADQRADVDVGEREDAGDLLERIAVPVMQDDDRALAQRAGARSSRGGPGRSPGAPRAAVEGCAHGPMTAEAPGSRGSPRSVPAIGPAPTPRAAGRGATGRPGRCPGRCRPRAARRGSSAQRRARADARGRTARRIRLPRVTGDRPGPAPPVLQRSPTQMRSEPEV